MHLKKVERLVLFLVPSAMKLDVSIGYYDALDAPSDSFPWSEEYYHPLAVFRWWTGMINLYLVFYSLHDPWFLKYILSKFKWFGFNFCVTGRSSRRIEGETVPSLHGKAELIQINFHSGINLWHSEWLSSRRGFYRRCDQSVLILAGYIKAPIHKNKSFWLAFVPQYLYSEVKKLPIFDVEVPEKCLKKWREHHQHYGREMSSALQDDDRDSKNSAADKVYRKYKEVRLQAEVSGLWTKTFSCACLFCSLLFPICRFCMVVLRTLRRVHGRWTKYSTTHSQYIMWCMTML